MDEIVRWSLYAIVFAAPFSKSISEIGISLAIAAWVARRMANKDFNLYNVELGMGLMVYVITILPSFINTAYPALSVKALFTKCLKYVFLCVVMSDSLRTRESLKDLLVIGFISAIVINLDGLIQHYTWGYDLLHFYPSFTMRLATDVNGFFRGYPTASFPYPNDLAAWILLIAIPIICVSLFDMKGSRFRWLTAASSVGLLYLFVLAKVRGAWLALLASMTYIALSKKKVWLAVLVALAVFASFVVKTEMTRALFSKGSFGDRFNMLDTSYRIFAKHPVIGNGLNTFFVNFKEHRNDQWKGKKGSYAHNCYLQMACDTGIVGLFGFLFFVFSFFGRIIKELKRIKDDFFRTVLWGLSIGIFAFLAHSFFDTNLYSLNLATLFWFAIGTSLAIARVSRSSGL